MKRAGTNACWNGLPAEQRRQLEEWRFEEGLSCREIFPRAQTELGFKGSLTSLRRYYERRRKERSLEKLQALPETLAEISGAAADPEAIQAAAMKLAGNYVIERLQEAPEKVDEWAPVANWMARSDYNQLLRTAKAEEIRVRREAIALSKERFECDVMERALKALPELLELAEAKKDPLTKRYEENARWNRLRLRMFGFLDVVHPQSAEEEAEMIAAKKEREARRERAREMTEEKIVDAQPPTPSSPHYEEYVRWKGRQEAEGWEMSGEYEI